MKTLVKDLIGPQFKNYVSRYKNCSPGISWVIEPKFGILTFDFKDIKPKYVEINVKRVGGNGLCTYISDGQLLDFKVLSQRYQKMIFGVGSSGIIEFKRNKSSVGNIEISGISLYVDEKKPIDWNTILRKCKSSGISVVDGHLLASEGSTIKADKIDVLETSPPNVYSLTENDVYFTSKCEILRLEVKGNSQNELYKHFESDPNVIKNENPHKSITTHSKTSLKPKKKQIENPGVNRLVFDSSVSGFQKYSSSGTIEINKDYLVMDFNAEYKIPLKFIYPDSDYIIIVEASCMSGNGKITMTLDNALNDDNVAVMVGSGKRTLNKKIRVSSNVDGANLIIGRSPSGKGKILINKILLILDIDKIAKAPKKVYNNSYEQSGGNFLSTDSDDAVLASALAFSRHISHHGFVKTSDLSEKITVQTFSGMSWFSKVQPLFPNVSLNDKAKTLVSSIKNINGYYDSIYIEEFGDFKPDKALEAKLKHTKKIITSCERNAEFLSQYGNVEIGAKFWPYVLSDKITFIKEKFIVLFNRNTEVTKKIIYELGKEFGRVVVLGARGRYPDFVIPINEYLDYRNLMWIFENAECIIDVPLINDYISGALDLVLDMGVPVATSNWKYQDRVLFLNSTERFTDYKIPSEDLIKDGIRELVGSEVKRKQLSEDYNVKVIQGVRDFYGG